MNLDTFETTILDIDLDFQLSQAAFLGEYLVIIHRNLDAHQNRINILQNSDLWVIDTNDVNRRNRIARNASSFRLVGNRIIYSRRNRIIFRGRWRNYITDLNGNSRSF